MINITYRFNNIQDISLLAMEFTKEFDNTAAFENWKKETEQEKGVEIVIISKEEI